MFSDPKSAYMLKDVCNAECLRQLGINTYYRASECLNEAPCVPYECPNFSMCGAVCPMWILNINFGTCINCAIAGRGHLVFTKTTDDEVCPVCLEKEPLFAIYSCGHKVGTECISEPFIPGDRSATEFGAPDDDEENWENDQPLQYAAYVAYMDEIDERRLEASRLRKSLCDRCPICRDDRGLKTCHHNGHYIARPDLVKVKRVKRVKVKR